MPGSTTAVAGDRFPARSNTVVLGVQVVVAPVLLVEAEDAVGFEVVDSDGSVVIRSTF